MTAKLTINLDEDPIAILKERISRLSRRLRILREALDQAAYSMAPCAHKPLGKSAAAPREPACRACVITWTDIQIKDAECRLGEAPTNTTIIYPDEPIEHPMEIINLVTPEEIQEQKELDAIDPVYEETQKSISDWGIETFGLSASALRLAIRMNEEVAELLRALCHPDIHKPDNMHQITMELADVYIVLVQVAERLDVDLHLAVDQKMETNRGRTWKLDGTGHGYHVKGAQDVPDVNG